MKKPIDIVIVSFQRRELTFKTINYLRQRTKYPYRLFVVDNHSTDGTAKILDDFERQGVIFHWVRMSKNVGIHMAKNVGLSLVESDYYIDSDNDIYVPDLKPDWLTQLVDLLDKNTIYGAIACQPHVFLGRSKVKPDKSGVTEVGHCGGVMRIMRTDLVRKVDGWDRRFDAHRNHEEKTICSRIKSLQFKVGYANDITCYHDFGNDNNWGYKDIHPHVHGHRIPGGSRFATDPDKKGEIWPAPGMLNDSSLDNKTWRKK